uniref:outer membrane beta-barrel protein n=1 Tax=Fulvivirga sp. TaxID=1931237 RepID=UPI004048F020
MKLFNFKTLKYALTLMILATVVSLSKAQEEEEVPTFTLSGSVDTYYRANLNSTNDLTNGGTTAPGTSFANLPGFSLGMANLIGTYTGKKTGVVADLVFGPRGADAVFNSPASLNIVNQLYVYWNVSDAVTLTLGNFNTFLGYEVISPTGNFNYSTSYMFSYGPFSHSGLKADFDLGGGFSLMLAAMNATDYTDFSPDGTIYGGAQLGYSTDATSIYLNTIIADGFFQGDITAGFTLSEKAYLGLNATSASDNFTGAAAYFQVASSDALKFGVRGEYFQDKGLGLLGLDETVFAATLSANIAIENLTLIPEFRLDSFSEKDIVITDFSNTLNPKTASSLSSFVLAAVYSF